MTLAEQIAALQSKTLTASDLVARSILAINAWKSALNAFATVDDVNARDNAEKSDARRARGQALGDLDGVPLAHKDMFDRVGHRCRFGSRLIQRKPDEDAIVIQLLHGAGTITVGALNMSEFALGPTGHNAVFGPCRNPWDRTRITGGSSSGSAAVVAAGIVGGSLGSDTGGSIRVPASCCGVVGLKTTQGRISLTGAMPLAPSLDCIGPIARSAKDCAVLFRLIAGADAQNSVELHRRELRTVSTLASVRFAFPYRGIEEETEPQVAGALREAVRVFTTLGAEVVPTELPNIKRLHDLADVIQQSEAASIHLGLLAKHRESYTPQIRRRIERGLFIGATAYLSALNQRTAHLKAFLGDTIGEADALILPTLGLAVPRICESDETTGGASSVIVERMTRWTRWLNYLGVPALSIPCGIDFNGMPIGMQLVGRPFSETALLSSASNYQEHTSWHARVPPSPNS